MKLGVLMSYKVFTAGKCIFICTRFHENFASGLGKDLEKPKGVKFSIFFQLLYTSVKILKPSIVRWFS